MKRTLLVAMFSLLTIPTWVVAITFEPMGLRNFARQIGIGCGQGYHSKPVPSHLRPHYERVRQYQAWRVCPPPAYPTSPTAPVAIQTSPDWNGFPAATNMQAQFAPSPDPAMPAGSQSPREPLPAPTGSRTFLDRETEANLQRPAREPTDSLRPADSRAQESTRNQSTIRVRERANPGEVDLGPKIVRRFTKRVTTDRVDKEDPSCSETKTDSLLRKLEQYDAEMDDMGLGLEPVPMPSTAEPSRPATDPNITAEPHYDEDDLGDEARTVPTKRFSQNAQNDQNRSYPFSSATPKVNLDRPTNGNQRRQVNPYVPNLPGNHAAAPTTRSYPASTSPAYSAIPAAKPTYTPPIHSRQANGAARPPTVNPSVPGYWPATRVAPPTHPQRPPTPRSYGNPNIWW